MNDENLKQIQLTKWHETIGKAKLVPFAGYLMPVLYTSVVEEHSTVRNAAGLFDVSHMGRMWFRGKDAQMFLDMLVPRDVTQLPIGKAIYCFALSERATFKDDLIIARFAEHEFLLVWNAGNYDKIKSWICNLLSIVQKFTPTLDLKLDDVTATTALFALQGPKAASILKKLTTADPGRWGALRTTIAGHKVVITGTGYTGEAGCEIMVLDTTVADNKAALACWNAVLDAGKEFGIKPIGLGARDSLRMEAGLPLYGNDIDENRNPVEAALFFVPFVHVNKNGYYFGKNVLVELAKKPPTRKRVGIISTKRKAPRHGMLLYLGDKQVGEVTSGAFVPTIGLGIGMGYVDIDLAKPGTMLLAKEGDHNEVEVKLSDFPLYDPTKYGHKRKV